MKRNITCNKIKLPSSNLLILCLAERKTIGCLCIVIYVPNKRSIAQQLLCLMPEILNSDFGSVRNETNTKRKNTRNFWMIMILHVMLEDYYCQKVLTEHNCPDVLRTLILDISSIRENFHSHWITQQLLGEFPSDRNKFLCMKLESGGVGCNHVLGLDIDL